MDAEASTRKTKREVVKNACTHCRSRKSKCDGKRPSCSSCQRKGLSCVYDPNDGRRIIDLRTLNETLSEKVTIYEELITLLKEVPEENAFEVFRRLRASSSDVADYLNHLRTAARASMQASTDLLRELGSPDDTDPGSTSDLSPMEDVNYESFHEPNRGSSWHPALRISVKSPPASLLGPERSGELYATPGYVEVFGNLPFSSSIASAGYSESIQSQQMLNYRLPIHLVQPIVVIEDSPLSRVYTDYRDAARQLIASGAPLVDILGPQDYVNVDLYFRERQPNDPFSANFWACETFKTFDEFDGVVKLGVVALLTPFMRWLIHPTPETYANVPDLMKPTPSQRLIPHVPATDTLINPVFRDATISRFRDWVTPLSQTMELRWPYGSTQCLERDKTSGCVRLTKQFEEFAKVPNNWSWRKSILKAFPEVKDRVKISE